jgi:hypothetical protein
MKKKAYLLFILFILGSTLAFALSAPVLTDPWHTADEISPQTFGCCNFTFPATTAFSYVYIIAQMQVNNTIDNRLHAPVLLNSNVTIYGDYINNGRLWGQSPRIVRKKGGASWTPWMAPGIYSNESGIDMYISTNNGTITFLPAVNPGGESTSIFPNGSIRMGYISTLKNISVEKKLTLRLGWITKPKYILNSTVLCKKTDKSLGVCQNITQSAANTNCTCV